MKDYISRKERLSNPWKWQIFDEALLVISYLVLLVFILIEVTNVVV